MANGMDHQRLFFYRPDDSPIADPDLISPAQFSGSRFRDQVVKMPGEPAHFFQDASLDESVQFFEVRQGILGPFDSSQVFS
jgi:hypothetical protein